MNCTLDSTPFPECFSIVQNEQLLEQFVYNMLKISEKFMKTLQKLFKNYLQRNNHDI